MVEIYMKIALFVFAKCDERSHPFGKEILSKKQLKRSDLSVERSSHKNS